MRNGCQKVARPENLGDKSERIGSKEGHNNIGLKPELFGLIPYFYVKTPKALAIVGKLRKTWSLNPSFILRSHGTTFLP